MSDLAAPRCPRLSRRALLASGAATVVSWGRPSRGDVDPDWRPLSLDLTEARVEGSLSRRFVLGVPRTAAPVARFPLLVLLHGLGEMGDERTGAWAWFERYGLGSSYDRVIRPGQGLVLACPYLPSLRDSAAVDGYARWLVSAVVQGARARAPVDESRTYLAGCSLGGRVSLDVLLRVPEAFGAWGGVQTAIDEGAAERYAERLASGRPRAFFVETSSGDPFRRGNEALSRALGRRGTANTYVEPVGPHDQPWLRRTGTANLLAWFAALPA